MSGNAGASVRQMADGRGLLPGFSVAEPMPTIAVRCGHLMRLDQRCSAGCHSSRVVRHWQEMPISAGATASSGASPTNR